MNFTDIVYRTIRHCKKITVILDLIEIYIHNHSNILKYLHLQMCLYEPIDRKAKTFNSGPLFHGVIIVIALAYRLTVAIL